MVDVEPHRLTVTVGGPRTTLTGRDRVRRHRWWADMHHGVLTVTASWPVREVRTSACGRLATEFADDVRHAGGDASDVDALARAIGELAGVEPGPLDATLWRAAYPLLRPAVDAGFRPDEVPDPLDRLLHGSTVRAGAEAQFGRVTRPLVRAVAARLVGDRPVFDSLVVATMALPCGPEQLTELIATDPVQPGAVAFDVGDVIRARVAFADLPARRVRDELRAALTEPDGLADLAERIAAWTPTPGVPARPEPRAAPDQRADGRDRRIGQRTPPAATVSSARAIAHPPRWRAVDGQELAGFRAVLPRTGDELVAWGRALSNCLGSYRHAAAAGRSRLLGLLDGGRLRYVVEVTPGGTIRQIEGSSNQRPDGPTGDRIARAVIAAGLADADGRTGRSLIAP